MQAIPSLDFIPPKPKELWAFASMLQKSWRNLTTLINNKIGFGDGTNHDNIDGVWANIVAPVAPNTDFVITHNLGRIPVGYWILQKDRACDVYTGGVAATSTQLTLRATVASAVLRLFIIGLLLALLGDFAQAQTTVNLTVQDTSGAFWSGPWTVSILPPSGTTPPPTPVLVFGGGSLATQTGTLSAGTATISLPANVNIAPNGTHWLFNVCFSSTGNCFTQLVTVSTTSPMSLTITPPPPPPVSGGVTGNTPEVGCIVTGTSDTIGTNSAGTGCGNRVVTDCQLQQDIYTNASGGGVVATLPTATALGNSSCNAMLVNQTNPAAKVVISSSWTINSTACTPAPTCNSLSIGVNEWVVFTVWPLGGAWFARKGTGTPTNLNTFFGQFMGQAPQDFGGKGDGRIFSDGGITLNQSIVSSAGAQQTCISADIGKVLEIVGAGSNGGSNVLHGLVASCSSGNWSISPTIAAATVTNQHVLVATDDTVAMDAWAAACSSGTGLSVNVLPASTCYLPKGIFYTQHPVRIVSPTQTIPPAASPGCGLVIPFAWNLNESCSIYVLGAGPSQSIIYPGTAGNFTWTQGSTVNNAVFYIKGWDGGEVSGIGVQGDTTSHNISGLSGYAAGIMFDTTAHLFAHNLAVYGMSSVSGQIYGFADVDTSEMLYEGPGQFEYSDNNGLICGMTSGFFNNTCEKITVNNFWFENPQEKLAFGNNANLAIGNTIGSLTPTIKQLRITNSHGAGAHYIDIRIADKALSGGCFDPITFTGWRSTSTQNVAANMLMFYSGTSYDGCVDFTDSYLEDTASGGNAAGGLLFYLLAPMTLKWQGGTWNCTNCTNEGQLSNASAFVKAFNVNRIGSTIIAGANAANMHGFFPSTTGWTGPGVNQGTLWVSNQGTACTNGELALSGGWQSTGSATVTAVAGNGQTCSWTITTGTTTAANPTVTDTLTNALPTATTRCWMFLEYGPASTHTAAAGEGFAETALSATAPIFTFNGTPTAGGKTYLVVRTCGP